MATFDLPETPPPHVGPNMLVGAASPLWGYFGAAAASGLAYWWMTRWTNPVNLEALFDTATRFVREPTLAAIDAGEPATEVPELPVGGESAPISPVAQAMAPEPDGQAAPEPASFAAEPAPESSPQATLAEASPVEPTAEPRAAPRGRRPASLTGAEDEA